MENVPFYFTKDLEADSNQIENNIINEKTRNKLGPYQNNDLIDKLSGGKFAETEKLVARLEFKD
ncbi:19526_t:CDS:2 [Funneliformis geosporum]|nr:19526_t:CDS:2 [Funneliformis geosporum]